MKDYGGAGGLKSVSVRSLGAAHTGVNYDGIPASDVQTGQIDLSKYTVTFVQSIDLQQGHAQTALQPARAYGAAALLSINTIAVNAAALQRNRWQGGLKAGSFGLWQPFAGAHFVLRKQTAINVNAEGLFSKGDYPYFVENGNLSETKRRANAEVKSFQGEVNLLKLLKDSSTLQVKFVGYHSSRGLPGAVVLYTDYSVQHLWNKDYYLQGRYRKAITQKTALLFSARASQLFTRYIDPAYLNNQGGINNRYTQNEYYVSGAISHAIQPNFTVSAASDASYARLNSNMPNFAYPSRLSLWNNLALNYTRSLWQLSGNALLNTIRDETKTGAAAKTINKLTPSIAFSGKLHTESPFMLRLSYKQVFRMPTFNDLYYRLVGNHKLRPEHARQYNAGIVFTKKHFSISTDGYYNAIKDKIVAVPTQNLFVWTMLNLGRVNIKGMDVTAEADGKIGNQLLWFARAAYTWQQALDYTNRASTTYKDRIPYTPDHSGSALASLRYHQWMAGYNLVFSGTRYVSVENNTYNQQDGFGVHDVFVSRDVSIKQCHLLVKAELNNLADQQYDIVRYYPMPGRTYKISLLFNNL